MAIDFLSKHKARQTLPKAFMRLIWLLFVHVFLLLSFWERKKKTLVSLLNKVELDTMNLPAREIDSVNPGLHTLKSQL